MATYTPVPVSLGNYEEAINENIRLILEVLQTKVYDADIERLLGALDAGGFSLINARDAQTNFEPINKRQLDNGV